MKSILQILDEAIKLELNVAELYRKFSSLFPDDAAFWWKLTIEETNHASLLRSGIDFLSTINELPAELVALPLEEFIRANAELSRILESVEATPPSRQQAFQIAITEEESAGEIHFQTAMGKIADTRILRVFQNLNQQDKNHAERLRKYSMRNNILIT